MFMPCLAIFTGHCYDGDQELVQDGLQLEGEDRR
jgi:hypothetical protein